MMPEPRAPRSVSGQRRTPRTPSGRSFAVSDHRPSREGLQHRRTLQVGAEQLDLEPSRRPAPVASSEQNSFSAAGAEGALLAVEPPAGFDVDQRPPALTPHDLGRVDTGEHPHRGEPKRLERAIGPDRLRRERHATPRLTPQ